MAPDINSMANWATDGYADNQVPRKEEYEIPGKSCHLLLSCLSCLWLSSWLGHNSGEPRSYIVNLDLKHETSNFLRPLSPISISSHATYHVKSCSKTWPYVLETILYEF